MGIKEDLRDIVTIMKFNLKIESRYPISYVAGMLNLFFWLLSFAIFVLMLLGAKTEKSMVIGNLIAYGFATYILFNAVISEVGFGIVRLQRRGTLEQIFLAPVSYWVLPLGLAGFTLIIHIAFMLMAIIMFVFLMGVPIVIVDPLMGFLGIVGLFIMIYGFALLFAGLTIKTKRSSWAVVNVFQFIYMLFCGAFYPFNSLPENIRIVSMLLPFSYGVDVFRTSIVGVEPELFPNVVSLFGIIISGQIAEMIFVFCLGSIFLMYGYIFFKKTIDEGKRKGYLGTY
ncbi:MAG: ABC transporter permease [Candidatus Njordarchaeota archaeon]